MLNGVVSAIFNGLFFILRFLKVVNYFNLIFLIDCPCHIKKTHLDYGFASSKN